MRLLYLVDGRSPIAMNWIKGFLDEGHEVHLVSTYPCETRLPFASVRFINVGFSSAAGSQAVSRSLRNARTIRVRTTLRHWLTPLTLSRAAGELRQLLERIEPDLIHAMRIPYEGMLAARAEPKSPLIISVWGNDFTLHAASTSAMARETQRALGRADALHTDCHRDVQLAKAWGYTSEKPSVVLPGNGGIKMDVFHPGSFNPPEDSVLNTAVGALPQHTPVIMNPRGFRGYVRNDAFFQSIPLILAELPEARFLCPGMAGEPRANTWVQRLGIRDSVILLPLLSQAEMAEAFRLTHVSVSPSEHDGTPNSLLEAMASGSYPVVGDLDSIREWIEPGVNGSLVKPADPHELAKAVVTAIQQPELRWKAAERNVEIIAERAEYRQVMKTASTFYLQVARLGN